MNQRAYENHQSPPQLFDWDYKDEYYKPPRHLREHGALLLMLDGHETIPALAIHQRDDEKMTVSNCCAGKGSCAPEP